MNTNINSFIYSKGVILSQNYSDQVCFPATFTGPTVQNIKFISFMENLNNHSLFIRKKNFRTANTVKFSSFKYKTA